MAKRSSPKKGSNIICRVANATPENVCKYVSRLPKHIMSKSDFRSFMGEGWFNNEHQASEQWGLYYVDDEEKKYYPRFNRDITLKEAEIYLSGWLKRLIVINPYTRFKTTNNENLVQSIVKHLEDEPEEHDLKKILSDIINSDEAFIVNEIIVNALNNYSEVLSLQVIDLESEKFTVDLKPNYKEVIKTKYNMTKKEYFDLFNDIKITSHQDEPRQQIYFGAPGTGKSFVINDITKEDAVIRTTFHPDSDYSSFVGVYKPSMGKGRVYGAQGPLKEDGKEIEEQKIVYKFVPQAFLKAYLAAWKKMSKPGEEKEPQFLIIEEINRGNCAQIFGDLFQLLDRSDNHFSCYPIEADTDLQQQIEYSFKYDNNYKLESPIDIEGAVDKYTSNYGATISEDVVEGRVLLLPPNLYIWATMNTSDQSLFPIDSAFKRRWDWRYIPISNANKGWMIEADGNHYNWWSFLDEINKRIGTATHSEDKKLGYFFCKADDNIITSDKFVSKVVFYLWNDVFKDFAEEEDFFKDEDGSTLSFNKFFETNSEGETKVLGKKVALFLNNLGIKPNEDAAFDEEENDGDGISERKETLISIQIPSYPTIYSSDSTQFDAVINALKIIGIDKILPIVEKLKYKRYECPVFSKIKFPELEEHKGFSYYQVGNLYVIKGCKSYTYIRALEDINDLLNIGLSLETK